MVCENEPNSSDSGYGTQWCCPGSKQSHTHTATRSIPPNRTRRRAVRRTMQTRCRVACYERSIAPRAVALRAAIYYIRRHSATDSLTRPVRERFGSTCAFSLRATKVSPRTPYLPCQCGAHSPHWCALWFGTGSLRRRGWRTHTGLTFRFGTKHERWCWRGGGGFLLVLRLNSKHHEQVGRRAWKFIAWLPSSRGLL